METQTTLRSSPTLGGAAAKGNGDSAQRSSVIRHNLPQMPQMRSHHSRTAVSKASSKASVDDSQINIVTMEELDKPINTKEQGRKKSSSPSSGDAKESNLMPPPNLPTPPSSEATSDTSPKAANQGSSPSTTGSQRSPSSSPPTPIKLRIRRSLREEHADGSEHSEWTQKFSAAASPKSPGGDGGRSGDHDAAPSPDSTPSHLTVAPQTMADSPRIGRTKTKGEIKKQLAQKKGKKGLASGEASPALEEASTPVRVDSGEATPEPVTEAEPTPTPPPPALATPPSTPAESDVSPKPDKPVSPPIPPAAASSKAHKAKVVDPMELAKPAKWLVGDMLWARVSGHPFWPCMVSYDPYISIYTEIKGKLRKYHVQFFGNEGERGWMSEAQIIPYEGREAFEQFCNIMKAQPKINRKEMQKYEVPARRRKAWEIAVKSSEEAFPMSRQERKQHWTFVYVTPSEKKKLSDGKEKEKKKSTAEEDLVNGGVEQKKKNKKRKLQTMLTETPAKDEEVNPDFAKSPPRKRQKRAQSSSSSIPSASTSESDTEYSPSHIVVPEQVTNRTAAQYMVFCQKRRDMIRREHPGYTAKQIEEVLNQQWALLDEDQKSKFIPMGSDVKNLNQMMLSQNLKDEGNKRSPRAIKPTKKKLEDTTGEIFKKRRKSATQSHGMAARVPHPSLDIDERPPSVASVTSLAEIDDIISGVAAGAGVIQDDWDEDIMPDMPQEEQGSDKPNTDVPVKKRHRKSKVATDVDPLLGTQCQRSVPDDETSSQTSSTKDDDDAKSKKRPKLTILNGEEYELEIFNLNSSGPSKHEKICHICEQTGELIQCEGPCQGTYHLSCLGLTVMPVGAFRCDECGSGRHACFVCKASDSGTKKCSISHCGRFYHEECVKKFPLTRIENGHIYCPMHTCATCAADNPKNPKTSKGRMYRCVRCPTAFHTSEYCLAAGSIHLAGLHIVCSLHFQPLKNQAHHSHINVSWCFLCSRGGTLLCCDSCPAAFHAECLKIDTPEGSWFCPDCSSGKQPLYGDVIWVKLGSYRWWPGEINLPRHVPLNIQEKPHQVGEFPVRFFGSHDFFWLPRARVFSFQEGDKGTKESTKAKGLVKIFTRAVSEATQAYKIWKEFKRKREIVEQEKSEKKPVPYKHIKANFPIGSVQIYKGDPSTLHRCECKREAACGPDSDCLNRLMFYECHPAVCPIGEQCMNQRFQKREYPDAIPFRVSERGWGLKTVVNIRKGQFVHEYVGDLIDEEEVHRRIKEAHDNDVTNFYMLTLDNKRIIDAGPKGNLSRFMNHSCQPNCVSQKWNVNGDVRVGLFALDDINAGSELTFNYNLDALGNEKTVCQCGAPNCSGFLGVRPKTTDAMDKEKRMKDKKKKKMKKPNFVKRHEDDCYRCGDGGELIMCDKTLCPKVYHLKCLKLSKMPTGKWICPWHHCDCCGKRSIKLCSECPNSFCADHIENNIFQIPDDKLVCSDHEDLLSVVEASKLEALPNMTGEMLPSTSGSETMSEESSPTHSDSDSGGEMDAEGSPKADVQSLDTSNCVGENSVEAPGTSNPAPRLERRQNRAASGHSDSDSSEGRLMIVEDDLSDNKNKGKNQRRKKSLPEATENSPSSVQGEQLKKRGRAKKDGGITSPLASEDKPNATNNGSNSSTTNPRKSSGTKKNGSKSKTKGLLIDPPEFDDSDDAFGDLVIDIPKF